MRVRNLLIFMILVILTSSCKKKVPGCTDASATNYNSSATSDNGSCTYNGSVTFWSPAYSSATVNINGQIGYISSSYPAGITFCDAQSCANFTIPAGNYQYTAYSSSKGWAGNINVAKGCQKVQLQ